MCTSNLHSNRLCYSNILLVDVLAPSRRSGALRVTSQINKTSIYLGMKPRGRRQWPA